MAFARCLENLSDVTAKLYDFLDLCRSSFAYEPRGPPRWENANADRMLGANPIT